MTYQELLQQTRLGYSQRIPVKRKTREVGVRGYINLYGDAIKLPHVKFSSERDVNDISLIFSHLWEQFFKYASIEARIEAKGDDYHHVTEDSAIAIGAAMNAAMRDRKSMHRSGFWFWPFEGSLGAAFVDYAGRSRATCILIHDVKNNEFGETLEHVLSSYSRESGADVTGYAGAAPLSMSRFDKLLTLLPTVFFDRIKVDESALEEMKKQFSYEKVPMANDHHKAEAFMKAFGCATKIAKSIDEENIGILPSTKGTVS